MMISGSFYAFIEKSERKCRQKSDYVISRKKRNEKRRVGRKRERRRRQTQKEEEAEKDEWSGLDCVLPDRVKKSTP